MAPNPRGDPKIARGRGAAREREGRFGDQANEPERAPDVPQFIGVIGEKTGMSGGYSGGGCAARARARGVTALARARAHRIL